MIQQSFPGPSPVRFPVSIINIAYNLLGSYNKNRLKKPFTYLLAILIVATILRVYSLDIVPSSLFGDEVDVGYQAYSLLKTGKDLYGNSWPTLIHSLSEYRAPFFIYSAIPFIAGFGLNEWGVRLPAVFFGLLGVLGIFLLTRKMFNEKIAILSAGFLAISPWHIHYSRAAFEVTMLLTFMVFATYFFIKGLERKYYFVVSAVLFGLTPYIYSTAVVFMPLLIFIMVIFFRNVIKKQWTFFLLAVVIMGIILVPYGWQTLSGKAGERFNVISVFGNEDLRDKVLLAQQTEQLSGGFQRFFHNKGLEWGRQISMNYLRAFSPEFLFLSGDPNPRHSIHEMGQMYLFELPLLLLGLFGILGRLWKNSGSRLVLGWLAIAPIPAALTFDGGFHATRNFLMLFPLAVLLSLGTNTILEKLKVKSLSRAKSKDEKGKVWNYLVGILMILIVFNVIFYLHRYFVHYPTEGWRAWHFGFKEAMQYVSQTYLNYDRILINNTYEPSLIRFLFWTKYDPASFHQKFTIDQPAKNITNGFDGFALDNKFFFGKFIGPYEQLMDGRTLFIASARDDITNPETLYSKNVRFLGTIYSPTSEPIFYILSGAKNTTP